MSLNMSLVHNIIFFILEIRAFFTNFTTVIQTRLNPLKDKTANMQNVIVETEPDTYLCF